MRDNGNMSDPIIDLRIIASTTGAEAGLKRVGTVAETELGAGGRVGKAGREAELALSGVGGKSVKAGKEMETAAKIGSGGFSELASAAGLPIGSLTSLISPVGLVAAGVAILAGASILAFQAFSHQEDANASLSAAMKAAGEKVTPAFTKSLHDAQAAAENLGFQQEDVTNAMAKMTEGGLTAKQAFAQLSVIQDLARARHISLADATTMYLKTINGATRAVKEYNIQGLETLPTTAAIAAGVKALAKDHDAVTVAQDAVTAAEKKYGDQSPQALKARAKLEQAQITFRAQEEKNNTTLSVAHVRANNLQVAHEQLGKVVGGQATAYAHTLGGEWDTVSAKFGEVSGVVVPAVIRAFSGFIGVLGTVIAAVAGFVGGVIGFIGGNSPLAKAFKIIGAIMVLPFTLFVAAGVGIATHIKPIIAIFTGMFATIKGIIGGIGGFFSTAFGTVSGIISGFSGAITGAVRAVVNPIITIIDLFISGINILITGVDKVIGAIPFVGTKLQIGKIPAIPHLYEGGIALGSSGGSLAVVGDQNQDEAIIPLPKNWRTGGGKPGTNSGGGSDGKKVTIIQYITTSATPDAINRATLRGLRSSGVTAI